MALSDVQTILQGLNIARERHVANANIANQEATRQNEADYRQKQIDLQHDTLDQQDQHFQLSNKLAQKMFDLQSQAHQLATVQQKMAIAAAPMSELASYPGATVQPNAMDFNSNIVNIPGLEGGPITHQTTQAENEARTAQVAAAQAPIQANELARDKANKDAALAQEQYIQAQENARGLANNRSRESVSANERATQLAIAKLHEGIGDDAETGQTGQALAQMLQQGRQGQLSQEALQKSPLAGGQKKRLADAMAASGNQFLPQKTIDGLNSFEAMPELFKHIDNVTALQKANPIMALVPTSDAHRQIQAEQAAIENLLPDVARKMTESGRLSNTQLKMVDDAAHPSLSLTSPISGLSTADINTQKRNSLLNTLRQEHEKVLKSLPPAQADFFRTNSAFHQVPYAGAKSATSQYQPGQTVKLKNGNTVTIKKINPDGSFDY